MAIASLPPGFRFHPTDIELILYYLKRKVLGKPIRIQPIAELDLYKFSPWDLPDKACLRSRDLEWYFFCPRDRKYANGLRTNRATEIGYWKMTGRDRAICNDSQTVGMKKTLIFHLGRAPHGTRTDWVMHEYRLEIKDWVVTCISQDSYVLCKIFEKSGAGPKNGEQHGAPFKEEEWEDNLMDNFLAPLPLVDNGSPSIILNDEKNAAREDSTLFFGKTCESSLQSPCQNVSSDANGESLSLKEEYDMDELFAILDEENDPSHIGSGSNEMPKVNFEYNVGRYPHPSDGNEIFGGLEDLNTNEKRIDNSVLAYIEDNDVLGQTLGDGDFLELDDFDSPMKYPFNGDGPQFMPSPR